MEAEDTDIAIKVFFDSLAKDIPMVAFIVGTGDQHWYLCDTNRSNIFDPTEINADTFQSIDSIEALMEFFEKIPMGHIHFGRNHTLWN